MLPAGNLDESEVCHPHCAFKLYGEVNSVKKHNYKIWLNDDEVSTSPRGLCIKLKLNSVALVRERTIPTERPPPVGEVSANFCG